MTAGLLASCSNSEETFIENETDREHTLAQLNILPTVGTETRAGLSQNGLGGG